MSEIHVSAVFSNIPSSNLAAFKDAVNEAVEISRSKDPGTLEYTWCLTDDESACFVRESYSSSEARLAHMANLGPLLGKIMELTGGIARVDVVGDPSPELLAAGAVFNPVVYNPFAKV